ncbi:MAG TPA: methyltransferase domain-containing protein [Nocardioidaceae bacterium]|jgi:phosphohistidine phosphatase SixA/SAM-dependent methyltransferase|nr:methyltransferase domain-containing protein [Nocardioidaceae bacterium]
MSERTLILLRHAKSDWSGDTADIDRPLADRGRRQAPGAGRWLAANIDSIDLAVVSPAARTRSTWELVAAELNVPPHTRIDDRLYAASGDELLTVVRGLHDDVETAILVGHNPGMEELASLLTGEPMAMKTSVLAVITVSGSWGTVAPHASALRAWGRPPTPSPDDEPVPGDARMQSTEQLIHQHPLAYLLGLEGIALMRAFAGEHGRAFTEARLTEVRRLLDRADELGPGVDVVPLPLADGYDGWALTYDGEDNGCFPMRDDVLQPMLDRLTPGRVLDAACGTGAVAQQLLDRGHDVVGVDISEGMLAQARKSVPGARLFVGDITDLPLRDGGVEHVVCTLALTHLSDLRPFFAEAARVMRVGGHLLLLDTRGHFTGSTRYPLVKQARDGRVGYVAGYSHSLGDYLRAALRNGYLVRACEETYQAAQTVAPDEKPEPLTPGPPDIWELHPWVRDATNAAKAGQAAVVAWDFELRPEV